MLRVHECSKGTPPAGCHPPNAQHRTLVQIVSLLMPSVLNVCLWPVCAQQACHGRSAAKDGWHRLPLSRVRVAAWWCTVGHNETNTIICVGLCVAKQIQGDHGAFTHSHLHVVKSTPSIHTFPGQVIARACTTLGGLARSDDAFHSQSSLIPPLSHWQLTQHALAPPEPPMEERSRWCNQPNPAIHTRPTTNIDTRPSIATPNHCAYS